MSRSAAADRAEKWIDPALVLPLLQRIEALEPEATGAFVLGTERQPNALVLVQHARICWAVSARMRGRLTDLIVAHGGNKLERAVIERIYQRCRDQRRRLGETLVAEGVVSADGLRATLLQHTSEALLSAECGGGAWQWVPHEQLSYDAAYTFRPAEIYVSLTAVQRPDEALVATQTLERAAPDIPGLAYLREHGATAIVARGIELDGGELHDTGAWLASVLDVSNAFNPRPLVVLSNETREALVVWERSGIAYVVACADPSDTAYVIAARRHRT